MDDLGAIEEEEHFILKEKGNDSETIKLDLKEVSLKKSTLDITITH